MPLWGIISLIIIAIIFGFIGYCCCAIAGENDEQRERDYLEWLKQRERMKNKQK